MFSSAELIEALRRRMRRSLRPPPPPGEFPPGWRDWFAAMAAPPGHVAGARPEDVVAVLAARKAVPPPGIVEQMGRWRAFSALWRQGWYPASADERGTRVAAMSGSLLLHVLFIAALVWLMVFRLPFAIREEAAARDGDEHVLQVEYIGEGTPADATGGGAPEAVTDEGVAAEPAPALAPAVPVPREAQPAVPEPADTVADEPVPMPEVVPPPVPVRELAIEVPDVPAPPLPAPQQLQLTVVEIPDSGFVVPPPRELDVQAPDSPRPDVAVRSREIELPESVEIPAPAVRAPRGIEVPAPAVAARDVTVPERAVELAEAPEVRLRTRSTAPRIDAPEPRPAAATVQARDVPMPATPASRAGNASASSPTAGEGRADAPSTPVPGGRRAASAGDAGQAAASAGAGAQAGQAPGALPSTRVADDWGDSTRNAPGGQRGTPGSAGLFDGDGRPRLADGGAVGGGLPPGTITEDFENVDRHGTWLKRPPYDYEPTAFDRFWMPSETLLEEWVRKSVTEVRIPIPGTTKSIRCVTVMLALGGACGIVDPNLQEQSAGAREPPDVPFKPELMEDQDALGPMPPPGG